MLAVKRIKTLIFKYDYTKLRSNQFIMILSPKNADLYQINTKYRIFSDLKKLMIFPLFKLTKKIDIPLNRINISILRREINTTHFSLRNRVQYRNIRDFKEGEIVSVMLFKK